VNNTPTSTCCMTYHVEWVFDLTSLEWLFGPEASGGRKFVL